MSSKEKDVSPSSCRSSCVKIYLCSNPEDSVIERRALREKVFPRFREYCERSLGLDMRVIDPFESDDPGRWPDENTRRKLIEECRQSSAGPFLLALVGHQYGTACLPAQVEVSEYQLLLQESQQADVCTGQLETAYRRDENMLPPSYRLRPSHMTEVNKEDDRKREEELMEVFQTAVNLCVYNRVMTPERAHVFYRSALDADLRFALDGCPVQDISNRSVVYVHKVFNTTEDGGKRSSQPKSEVETSLNTAPTQSELLSDLCDNFLHPLATSCQLLLYTITTKCDHRHGYTTARRRSYAISLCQQVLSDLVMLTDSLIASPSRADAHISGASDQEWREQEQLCSFLSGFYDIILPEEDKVRSYVKQWDQQCPLVVAGGPCTGKTVLVAHCAQQIKSWLADCYPVVISYFYNLSINSSPKRLLSSLCSQIACRYDSQSLSEKDPNFWLLSDPDDPSCNINSTENGTSCSLTSVLDSHWDNIPEECLSDVKRNLHTASHSDAERPNCGVVKVNVILSELRENLKSLLSLLPSTKYPLVLILDGLDQLEKHAGDQMIRSLPSLLPHGVKLIITLSSKSTCLLQVIKSHYPEGSPTHCASESGEKESGCVFIRLESVEKKQYGKLLESLLETSGRKVTSGQQVLVNKALNSCCLPLYTRLLHAHTSLWYSDSDVTESSLSVGVHSSISALLDHLELKYVSSFVVRAVSYLTLSRTGLTEAELVDLLSWNEDVLPEEIFGSECRVSETKVSQVDVEMLLLDLKNFLVKRTVSNTQVLFWVSRHFNLVIAKMYLYNPEMRRKMHSKMADYFGGRYSFRDGKQHPVKHLSEVNNNKDGQKCSQLFMLPASDRVGRVNVKKVLELVYHLQQCGRCEELECRFLMSPGFHQAMVQAGLLDELIIMLQNESSSKFLRERLLLASLLKCSACLLQLSPLQLPAVMETSLVPYLGVFPALHVYVEDNRKERVKNKGGLELVLCPSPRFIPPICYLRHDVKTKRVKEVDVTECGVVAEVLDDGSVWIWKGCGHHLANLLPSCERKELKFTGVKSSGHFLLLSSECNKLFVWDVNGPERLLEINHALKTESESSPMPNKVKGFIAMKQKFCMWYKDETFVSVFYVLTETTRRFQCHSSVTCLACSFNGFWMYCGQEDGDVVVFDMETSCFLATCSNSNCSAVMLIILNEEKHEMACVDRTGSVALWDVADKMLPPRLVKETFNQDKSHDILNTDYCKERSSLLVCQSHQVTLWDTCDWELQDQFLAPQRRAFTQAVLSMDGHLFLALLDTGTFILVWRLSTGECVLSLETNMQPHSLLKLPSEILYVSHDGCLTVWDSDMIDAAGTFPKMKGGVREMVIDQTGKWFYTTDGSENVWRWSLDTGVPHINFLHDDPVKKMQLSPNSVHLVSLSATDIYVWQTETGWNILRISGSRATDVLITPNSNFGVSLSKQGLSRVWKIAHGAVVCSIHQYLSDAQVSPESTFLIGLCCGELLAASLWSGLISKRFSCVEDSERVLAFHALSEHPDFVVVMVASGSMYTWKLSEETVCRHFQLPHMFHCQPQDFQTSSDGSHTLLSIENNSINVLDLTQVRLFSLRAKGLIIKACLDINGYYMVYISDPSSSESTCSCYLHAECILMIIRLSDGKRIGSTRLHKKPMTLTVSEQRMVFVGFDDGSVGVYYVSDGPADVDEMGRDTENFKGQLDKCPFDRRPLNCFSRFKPNVTWP